MARRCNCVYVSMYCWQINNIWLTLNDGDTIADQLLFECTVRCYAKSTRLIKACNYWDNGTKDMSAIKSIVLHHHNRAAMTHYSDGGSQQGALSLLLLYNCYRAPHFNVHHTDIINISAAAHNGRSDTSLPSWQPRRTTMTAAAAWCQEAAGHKSRWFLQRVMLLLQLISALVTQKDTCL